MPCGPRCPHLFPPLTMVTSSPGRPISQGQEHNSETYTGRCTVCALCRCPNTTPTGRALPGGLRALPSALGASPLLCPFVDALELPPSPALSIKTPPFKTLLCPHPNTDSSPGRPLPGVHLPRGLHSILTQSVSPGRSGIVSWAVVMDACHLHVSKPHPVLRCPLCMAWPHAHVDTAVPLACSPHLSCPHSTPHQGAPRSPHFTGEGGPQRWASCPRPHRQRVVTTRGEEWPCQPPTVLRAQLPNQWGCPQRAAYSL